MVEAHNIKEIENMYWEYVALQSHIEFLGDRVKYLISKYKIAVKHKDQTQIKLITTQLENMKKIHQNVKDILNKKDEVR